MMRCAAIGMLLTTALWAASATAQTVGPTPALPLSGGGTITGSPTTITVIPNSIVNPIIETTAAFDYSTASSPIRWNMFATTLAPSVNTANIWENFTSSVTLNGPGQSTAEINQFHGQMTVSAGAVSTSAIENYEARLDNSGTMSQFVHYLTLLNNGASATIGTSAHGMKCQLSNANASAGSIASYACIDMEAMTGGGSTPTTYYLLRNADSAASINTLGKFAIGNLALQSVMFSVQGPDTSDSTQVLKIQDSATAALMTLTDGGTLGLPKGVLNLGTGANWGKLFFGNTTSGTIQLSAPSSGALGSAVATLPTGTTNLLGSTAVNSVSPTSPNRTISVAIGGTTYFLAAKTTND